MKKPPPIQAGQRYGLLVAVRHSFRDVRRHVYWLFRCDCGQQKNIRIDVIKNGGTISCGCQCGRHGTHHMSRTPEFRTWHHIKQRCFNPNNTSYKNYGQRGITMSERWVDSFENFFADVGPRPTPFHSIDRIDNDGDYEPNNCRWATLEQQSRNMRTNHVVEYQGRTICLAELAEVTGVSSDTLFGRLKFMSVEEAIRFPHLIRRKNGLLKGVQRRGKKIHG